jgi:hypothetical protein
MNNETFFVSNLNHHLFGAAFASLVASAIDILISPDKIPYQPIIFIYTFARN